MILDLCFDICLILALDVMQELDFFLVVVLLVLHFNDELFVWLLDILGVEDLSEATPTELLLDQVPPLE